MITGEAHPTAKTSPPKLIQAVPNAAAVHWEPHPPQELISLQVSGTGMSIGNALLVLIIAMVTRLLLCN